MRVKITGPVTPERLVEALERVALTFEGVYGEEFVGFFGANLYVQAYTKDGRQVEVAARGGKEMVISLRLPPGAIAKPALSDELLAEREELAAKVEEQRRTADERDREAIEERRARIARRDQADAEQKGREMTFQAIVAAGFGEDVVRECNTAIKAVWDELRPVWPNGQKKGQPRAMPHLAMFEGTVFLHAGNRPGDGQRIKTPLSKRTSYGSELEPYWKSPEWKDGAVPALTAVIEGYAKRLAVARATEDSQAQQERSAKV